MYKHNNFKTITNFFTYLLLDLIVINAVLLNNFYNINVIHRNEIKTVVEKTIKEFDEIDLQHLCVVSACKEIGFINVEAFKPSPRNNENILQSIPYNSPNFIFKSQNLTITNNLNTYIKFKNNLYIILDNDTSISQLSVGYIDTNILFIILYILMFLIFEFKNRRKKVLELMDTSNTLREKNMQILTENIHHELNTPVAIIQGNIKKLEIEMNSSNNNKNCPDDTYTRSFYFDFGQIYSSIEQIDTVLSRMSNFKNLKYSNGNKNLLDIIGYSSNSMSIYKKANFEIEVDPELRKYRLAGPLKNGDLLNIVSNHFRNSLEAGASRIVTQAKYDASTKTMHLYIIDNGVGLRDKETGLPLDKSKYNDIFKPYYTSKDNKGTSKVHEPQGFLKDSILKILSTFKNPTDVNVRGVGLYLNKQLLTEKNGDLILRETSSNGTVFEIIFPVLFSQKLPTNIKPETNVKK